MKHIFTLLIASIFTLSLGQIKFEKGYFIDNSNQRTECLIRNVDWKNSPSEFDFKMTEASPTQKSTLNEIREFGIYNMDKYVKTTLNIDRSSNNVSRLSDSPHPIFKEETMFLKVLVEGSANLYQFTEDNFVRYFYNVNNGPIEQLIYKRYFIENKKIHTNSQFKNQLNKSLQCETFSNEDFEKLGYNKNNLTKIFIEYNQCGNESGQEFSSNNKGKLTVNIRPRINSTQASIQNSTFFDEEVDLENKLGFSGGVEIEYVLPFNKNKWAVFLEGTYFSYKSTVNTDANSVSGGRLNVDLQYQSLQIPIGVRHYFFLSDNSKLFLDAAFVMELGMGKSFLELKRENGSEFNSLEIDANNNNFTFGIGYKLKDKYSAQFRMDTGKDILSSYSNWSSKLGNFSFILGYSLF